MRAGLLAIGLLAAALPARAAANVLVCRSNTYRAELTLGPNEVVDAFVLSDASGKRVPQPVTVTAIDPKHRTASSAHQSVDVDATTELERAKVVRIRLEHGRGYVEVGGDTEVMACDFGP